MGASPSYKICQAFSEAQAWIIEHRYGVKYYVFYLNDFFFIALNHPLCLAYHDSFLHLCDYLNIQVRIRRLFGLFQVQTFLGTELFTLDMEACLPVKKIQKYSDLVQSYLHKQTITLRDLQSVIGCLHFATTVIMVGRPFIRCLINLTTVHINPYHYITLTKGAKVDLEMWHTFLSHYNEHNFLKERIITQSPSMNLTSDASKKGFGLTFGSQWCQCSYPSPWGPPQYCYSRTQ